MNADWSWPESRAWSAGEALTGRIHISYRTVFTEIAAGRAGVAVETSASCP